jgi:hypothetical protein
VKDEGLEDPGRYPLILERRAQRRPSWNWFREKKQTKYKCEATVMKGLGFVRGQSKSGYSPIGVLENLYLGGYS